MLGHHIYYKNSFSAWQISGHDILLSFFAIIHEDFFQVFLNISQRWENQYNGNFLNPKRLSQNQVNCEKINFEKFNYQLFKLQTFFDVKLTSPSWPINEYSSYYNSK